MSPIAIQKALRELSNPVIAKQSLRFFRTGKGEYGEGDQFLGIRVPVLRAFAKSHRKQPLDIVLRLLSSRFHEERLLALIMMVSRFEKADNKQRQIIYRAYLDNTVYINNWDLVDSSAYQIVGATCLMLIGANCMHCQSQTACGREEYPLLPLIISSSGVSTRIR